LVTVIRHLSGSAFEHVGQSLLLPALPRLYAPALPGVGLLDELLGLGPITPSAQVEAS
jgi:hypothetical protein